MTNPKPDSTPSQVPPVCDQRSGEPRDLEALLQHTMANHRNAVVTKRKTDGRLRIALAALQKIYDAEEGDSAIRKIAGDAFNAATDATSPPAHQENSRGGGGEPAHVCQACKKQLAVRSIMGTHGLCCECVPDGFPLRAPSPAPQRDTKSAPVGLEHDERLVQELINATAAYHRGEKQAGDPYGNLHRVRDARAALVDRLAALTSHAGAGTTPQVREALEELERACEALATGRSQETYNAMLRDGRYDQLAALDVARRKARNALALTLARPEPTSVQAHTEQVHGQGDHLSTEKAEREPLTVTILKDVFDAIEHFHGKGGLDAIADFARMKQRSRESNELIDRLEAEFGLKEI